MSYVTNGLYFGFPQFPSLSFLAFIFVEPWLTIGLEISIQSIAIGPYMAMSFTVMKFPRRVLVSYVLRVHILGKMLRYMVQHHNISFLLKGDKLLSGNVCFFAHGSTVKSYSLHIIKHLSNL